MCSGWVRDGILGAALVTASRGWFVFPCRGKLPLTRHGFKAASVESADIETWWAEYPDATIGVSCGQSGLVVLDLDKKPGVDGETMLHDILGGLGAGWPDTLTSRTPSGGLHLFFRHDHTEYKIANSASMIAPGIDVRGDGGYVITPHHVLKPENTLGLIRTRASSLCRAGRSS